jgi:hypothetical protein
VCPFSLNKLDLGHDARAFVGFTAATGGRFQKHDIQNVKFAAGTCPNDCNLQGQCVDGECVCEGLYPPPTPSHCYLAPKSLAHLHVRWT